MSRLAELAFTSDHQPGGKGSRMSASGSGVVPANGIQIAYETLGDRGGRPLLMVMGLGASMLTWHPDLCELLAGRGGPLINVAAGRRTAKLVNDAELIVVPGMGHDLPRPVWPALADAITALADRAGHPR